MGHKKFKMDSWGRFRVYFCLFLLNFLVSSVLCSDGDKWKKKDIRDYNDADMERLFDQWEEADEDELEEDELPPWKKDPPKIDMSKLNPDDPESMLQATKTGQTLMMFITVSGDPTEDETQTISQIWQSSLFNANINVQRYVVGPNRVLFLLNDGSQAWHIKDFIVKQDRCEVVTIEGRDYFGKAHPQYGGTDAAKGKEEKKKKKKKKKAKSETKSHEN